MFMTHKSNGNRKRSLVRFIFTFISLFNFAGFFTVHESSTNRETVWNKGDVSYYLHFKPIPCNKIRISLCSHFYPVVITGIMFSLEGMILLFQGSCFHYRDIPACSLFYPLLDCSVCLKRLANLNMIIFSYNSLLSNPSHNQQYDF